MESYLHPALRRLLARIYQDGLIHVIDGDEPDFDETVMKTALDRKLVRTDRGSWSPFTNYRLTPAGLRAVNEIS